MKTGGQLAEYPILDGLKQFMHAEYLGGAAIVVYAWFLPLETRPDLATLVLITLGLWAFCSREGLRPKLTRLDYVVIAMFVVTTGISSLLSVDPARSMRFVVYACLNVLLLLLAATMISRETLRLVAGCLGLFGVLHLTALLLASLGSFPATPNALIRYPQMATLIVPNDALIMGLCLPSLVFFVLSNDARKPIYSFIAVAIYVALSLYVSYLLQSKLALISLMAALLVLAVARVKIPGSEKLVRHHNTVLVSTLGVLLLLSTAAWYLGNQSTTRLSLWSVAATAHTTTSEVMFGAGPNTFLYNPIAVESDFDKGDLIIPWVHNLYLEAYYEQGIFGLFGILALTMIPLTRALRIRDRSVRAMLVASLITFGLLALFEITLTRRFYFAFLAIMYGLSIAQASEEER